MCLNFCAVLYCLEVTLGVPIETLMNRKISMHGFWLDEDGSCPPRWCARRMRFPWCEETHSAAWSMPSHPGEAEYGVTGYMPSAVVFTMSVCVTASCHLACGQSDPNIVSLFIWKTLQRAPPNTHLVYLAHTLSLHTWFVLHTHYHYTPGLSCTHIIITHPVYLAHTLSPGVYTPLLTLS